MVEVFMTNIQSEILSKEILMLLEGNYPSLEINFDLEDYNKPYPCGHSILRIEGTFINSDSIIFIIKVVSYRMYYFWS